MSVRSRKGRKDVSPCLRGVQLQDQNLTTSQWATTMADISTFEQTYELADMLIMKATKEQLAECARVLALNLAHHQIKHGEVPVDQTLALLQTFEPTEEHLDLLVDGMVNLISVLLSVCGTVGEARH
jgi:hypothetical protein